MPRTGNIDPSNPSPEIASDFFYGPGYLNNRFGVPVSISRIVEPAASSAVGGMGCPLDSRCVVKGALYVVTPIAAGRTLDVGVSDDITTHSTAELLSAAALSAAGVVVQTRAVIMAPNQFITWEPSAATTGLVAHLVLTFTPMGV